MREMLTPEDIKDQTGFQLAVIFPWWQEDAAGIIEFHEELNRLEKEHGTKNVIGSLVKHENNLALGVFVLKHEIIPGEVVASELHSPTQRS